MHKSGFVNIIGKPNAGKSTLMNALVGEKMSIITPKPQTTRHRIIGILSGENFQIVFSDTPGIIEQPSYKMQQAMNRFALGTLEDADLILWVIEKTDSPNTYAPLIEKLKKTEAPIFLIINKSDLVGEPLLAEWQSIGIFKEIREISALLKVGTEPLLEAIKNQLPDGPEYYPKDQLTDRPERFFTAEIIREKIFLLYHQEIPYSCEVIIEQFKEEVTKNNQPIIHISGLIYVNRKTQKSILIGKNGEAIKKLGSEARKDIESFFEKKVFLELHVKVREDWRDDDRMLKNFGYTQN
jgi:GTPase